jgi:hypothetical protein
MDAYETADRKAVIKRLRDWIDNINLDTRKAFDEFVVDTRRITGAIKTSNDFVKQLRKAKLDFTSGKNERAKLRKALIEVRDFVDGLLNKLEGKDAPPENNEGE